jgi:hypothetical protein
VIGGEGRWTVDAWAPLDLSCAAVCLPAEIARRTFRSAVRSLHDDAHDLRGREVAHHRREREHGGLASPKRRSREGVPSLPQDEV